jgi:hypothetical protein
MDQTAGSQEPLRTLGGYLDDGPDRPARILRPRWPCLVLAMGNSNGDIAMFEQIRGPDPIAAGITAYEKHVRRHPLVGESTAIPRHAAQAWPVRKQAGR